MSANRCPYCTTHLSPFSFGLLTGLLIGASLMAILLFSAIQHFTPPSVSLSALDSCETKLERYAGVSAVADAIDRAQARNHQGGE